MSLIWSHTRVLAALIPEGRGDLNGAIDAHLVQAAAGDADARLALEASSQREEEGDQGSRKASTVSTTEWPLW